MPPMFVEYNYLSRCELFIVDPNRRDSNNKDSPGQFCCHL